MKRVSIILALMLVLVIGLSVLSCKPNNGTGGGNNTNNTNGDNSGATTNPDGYITGTATIEDVSDELIKTIFSTAKTASVNRLNASNPCVSWHIDLAVKINDRLYDLVFEINYDNRDKSATEIRLIMTKQGETETFVSAYYFADEPIDDKSPGNLYLQYGDAKVVIPLVDTFLGKLFPISFSGSEEDLVSGFVSANIFAKGDISYKYKDESDGKRTRNYVFQIDLKETLVNMINLMSGSSSFAEVYDSVSWIIESLFGVEVNKINSQLPDTTITLDMTTKGGSRTSLGKGSISNFKIDISAAASDYKDSVFRGESYDMTFELTGFKASSVLIADFPKEDDDIFASYISYNNTALLINGSLMYEGDEENLYDLTLGFRYDGLSETQEEDEALILVTEKGDSDTKHVEFYTSGGMAYLNFLTEEGQWVELSFAFDMDVFIEQIIEISSDRTSSMGFLKIVAYILGSFQIWEDGSLSLKVDAEFFKGILNLEIPTLVEAMQYAYTYAGGTGQICINQLEAQLGSGVTMANVLSSMIIDKEIVIILNEGEDSIDTTDSLIDARGEE